MRQFDQQLIEYIFSVMTRDALLTSHPVSAKIRDPDDITLYFDAISYDKVSHRRTQDFTIEGFTWGGEIRIFLKGPNPGLCPQKLKQAVKLVYNF